MTTLQRQRSACSIAAQPLQSLPAGGVTLAAYAVAAPRMYRERARLPLDDCPHLLAWVDRVRELPAWRNSEAVW